MGELLACTLPGGMTSIFGAIHPFSEPIKSVEKAATHDYVPDFVVRLAIDTPQENYLILETKGFDPLENVKKAAAERWTKAINTDDRFGRWQYAVAKKPTDVRALLEKAVSRAGSIQKPS
jgi:hypothetical protein